MTQPSKKTRLIIDEIGVDTETGIIGKGHSYDNGKTFVVDDTIYGRIYHKDDHGRIWKGIQDKVEKVVKPAIDSANSAVRAADDAVASAQVTSDAVIAIASATAEAKQGANDAMSRALSAWDVATGAKEAVTDFDPLLKSAQSDAGKALTQIADTASALSDAKTQFGSDVAAAKNLASAAQTTANSAIESASENAKALTSQANALSDARKAMDSDVASAKGLANAAQATADNAIKSASSVANDLATVASQAKANANGITKVTSNVGLLQTTVADNSGNISKIQETAVQLQQAVSDNSGAIVAATQTAQSATTVASDAKSNATVAVQTASGASVTAKNAQGDATTAMVTAKSAVTQASDAKSNATIAVQTASGASVTATNAQGDASFAKQTASDASVQIKNAQGDISKLQTRAGTIEASVATNSGAIADVQATANQLKASVSDNAGNITVAKQTADSAVAVASDARSNATVAIQTASGASLTATNAQGDATIAKQTASEAKVQASNAESDFAQLSIRANKIEANVATNSGAIASVQQTANGLTTTVADIQANGGGVNLAKGTSSEDQSYGDASQTTGWRTPIIATFDNPQAGQQYTISINAKPNGGSWRIQVWDGNSSTQRANWLCSESTNATQEQKHVLTFTWPSGRNKYLIVQLSNSNDGGQIVWNSAMLEEGAVAHTWSPAPDDVQNQFTQIKESINGVTTIINDPKTGLNATYQTAQGNASTISNVKGDVTQLQTTANGLTSRVGSLESKTATQQTAIEQNKNAIALKADQTNVDTVKGTVAGLQSSLTVQGNQIQTKVSASDVSGMLKGYATQDYTQSLVTQQANTLSSTITTVKNQVNSLESAIDWTTKTGALDMDTLTTTQNIYYRDTNLKNADGEAGWAYIQVVSMGERVTQTVWHDRSSIQHTRTGAVSGSSYNWDAWNRTATNAQISNLTQSLDGLRSTVAAKADQSEVTQLSNLIQAKVSSGDFTSTTTQLKNMINQRVQVGDVISQINQEAGGNTLIQVSNGKGSLILNADNTIITGKAWIPSAAIANLTADQVQAGTLKGVKVDFRDSTGTGMIADGSTLTFDVSNTPAGYLSYNGMPVAEIPDGSGGNELTIRYGLSTAIIPDDSSGAQATFSKAAQKIAYMTGTSQGKQMLSGLEVHSNNHHWLGAVNSDATYNRLEINSNDGVNLTWHDNTHFWISDGNAKLYKDNNDSSTATKLEVHGWAWINGWCEAAGHSQHSTLSSKTRIEEADPDHMLDLINQTELTTFAYKSELAGGTNHRHIGPIIDDINDVAQYQIPSEFIAPTKTARDDDNMIGALFGAVQALTKRINTLEEKTK
nr:MAG TPA: tail fiber protein [Caudoviricetes sp.]